jgi:periplasmic protein TonB
MINRFLNPRIFFLLGALLSITFNHSYGQIKRDIYIYAQFPGGQKKLLEYIEEKSELNLIEKINIKKEIVKVEFTIDTFGNVINIIPKFYKTEKMKIKAIKIIKSMPKWKPAIHNGIKESYNTTIEIKFK